jgi:hypothetical protein
MRRAPACGGWHFEQSKVVVEMRIWEPDVSLSPALGLVAMAQLRAHPLLGMRFDPTKYL